MLNKLMKNKVVTIGIEQKNLDTPSIEATPTDPQEIAQIATDAAVKVVGAVGVVAVGYKIVSTVCDIAKIAAKAKF
jgi:hypothetical protein